MTRTSTLAVVAFVFAPLAVVTAATQGGDRAPAAVVALRGVVIDAASGEPVRRARVEMGESATRVGAVMSDNEGRFSLDVPSNPQGSLRVMVTKAGYATQTRYVSAQLVRESAPLLIVLERGAAIVGRAVDLAGQPVPVTSVLVMRARDGSPVRSLTSVTPDERGEFRVGGLAPGRYTIDNGVGPSTAGLRADRVEVQLEAGQEVPVVLLFQPAPDGQAPTGFTFDAKTGVVTTVTLPRPASPPGGRAIRGIVTSTAGTPLAGATVIARRTGAQRPVVTDARGRFTIEGLPAGEYSVEAMMRGYVPAEHGQRGLDLPGIKVTVAADADTDNVDIVLPQAGALSGIVHDEFGEPLQDAAVQVVRVRRSANGLTAVREPRPTFVRTDDRGHFRAGNLMPGEYVVSATFSAHLVVDSVRAAYAPTFWPAAEQLPGAAPLEIRAGEEIRGVTFTLRLVPVSRISGVVVTSAGAPAAGTVRLMPAGEPDLAATMRTAQIGAAGEFSFDDVVAGEYLVQAQANSGSLGPEAGRQLVTVSDDDPDPVTIRTSGGSTLSGRLVLETSRPGDLMWGYSIFAAADGTASAPASLSNLGSPVGDGEPFVLSRLTGPTRLRAVSEDENWYLKSIVIDGFDAADAVFDFGFDGRSYRDVQIVFSRLGATITGRATDERARPVRDYAVYVFPADRSRWIPDSRWVRVTRARGDGSFRVPSLPPGSYWLVAVDRLDSAARTADPSDPALLDALSPHGVLVAVGESEIRDVTIRLLRR